MVGSGQWSERGPRGRRRGRTRGWTGLSGRSRCRARSRCCGRGWQGSDRRRRAGAGSRWHRTRAAEERDGGQGDRDSRAHHGERIAGTHTICAYTRRSYAFRLYARHDARASRGHLGRRHAPRLLESGATDCQPQPSGDGRSPANRDHSTDCVPGTDSYRSAQSNRGCVRDACPVAPVPTTAHFRPSRGPSTADD